MLNPKKVSNLIDVNYILSVIARHEAISKLYRVYIRVDLPV
jgi:hypothetical protein